MTKPLLHAAIFCAAVFFDTLPLCAQQPQQQPSSADAADAAPAISPAPVPNSPNAASEVPLPTGQASPGSSAIDQPISLMPENVPSIPKPAASGASAGAAAQQHPGPPPISKTAANAQNLKERIRFREVKTAALEDPAVQEQWDLAQSAPTDPARREALRQYYKLLFARMKKIDPSITARVDWMQGYDLGRLAQPYFDPKVTPNPTAQPKPKQAAPVPAPAAPTAASAQSPAVIGGGSHQ